VAGEPRREGLRALFAGLVDLEFHTIVTTSLLPLVYRVSLSAIAILVLGLVARGFNQSTRDGLLWLFVLGPAIFLGSVTVLRVFLEFVISIFRIAVHVEYVSRRLVDIADQTEEIAEDLPRIRFWRRRERS